MKSKSDHVQIRKARSSQTGDCEEIMRSLPEWFGIEQAIVDYRHDIETEETIVAEEGDRVIGFLTLKQHNKKTAEIQVMAVRRQWHRQGIGRVLVENAEKTLRSRGLEYLEVKTLGPSRPDGNYERTRKFYLALGFNPVEENKLWGEVNPCLILIKHLPCKT